MSFGEGRTKDDRAVEIGATAGAGVLGYFLGRQKDKQNVTVDVTAEDSTYRKSLYLKKGRRISGRISDSEGKPISRAQVSVYYARAAGSDPVPVMYQWENVLLSFAQFEREVTGERIRDKIAASKRKGMWMGGNPPLGYDVKDKKLIVNKAEAETVRSALSR